MSPFSAVLVLFLQPIQTNISQPSLGKFPIVQPHGAHLTMTVALNTDPTPLLSQVPGSSEGMLLINAGWFMWVLVGAEKGGKSQLQ